MAAAQPARIGLARSRAKASPPVVVAHFDTLDDLSRAACLLAVDPAGLGGLCLRGPADEARDLALARLREGLAPAPWRRLPPQIDDQRLLGGMDLGLSLAAGRPVHQAGLLAESHQGVLVLPLAERAPRDLAARLATALDAARDGAGPCFALIALDEHQGDDPGLAPALQDRLALMLGPVAGEAGPAVRELLAAAEPPRPAALERVDLAAARARLARLPFDAEAVQALCQAADALGLPAPRAAWQAWRVAAVAAACAGRDAVAQADLALAVRLVLAPRARCLPTTSADDAAAPPPAASPPAPPPPAPSAADADAPAETAPAPNGTSPDATDAGPRPDPARDPDATRGPPESAPDNDASPQPLEDQLIAAAQAAIPPGLLAQLAGLAPGEHVAGQGGRAGAAHQIGRRGRPLASRPGPWRDGARLDLPATLRAALPWQTLRRRAREAAGLAPAAQRLLLRREDLHLRRFHQAPGTTTLFVVDASGSQAMHRLAEAKGAVECLLSDCYVRRDRVALIAFRGTGADILLAPTRSLVRARRSLAALPGGGGTPLAAGIDAAMQLALQLQRRDGERAVLVFLTDARANIARDGTPGRPQALADALAAARQVRAAGLGGLLIDTSPRPQAGAAVLAEAMALRYVALPQAGATAVYAAVSQGLARGA